jgi:hypothetical protein
MHGIQSWVALPLEHEETDPRFEHHPASTIPRVVCGAATIDVIAGTAFGQRSPVSVLSPSLYAHARLEPGASFVLDAEHEERALYVVEGSVTVDGRTLATGTMPVFRPGIDVTIAAPVAARVMLVGGAKLEGPRHIFWNFVSSSKDRLERAKDDWRAQRFPLIPGDDQEFIPLPS